MTGGILAILQEKPTAKTEKHPVKRVPEAFDCGEDRRFESDSRA